MGDWVVIQPVATTNKVFNPRAGGKAHFAPLGNVLLSRSFEAAYIGTHSYKLQTTGPGDGIVLDIEACAGIDHTITVYAMRTDGPLPVMECTLNGLNWFTLDPIRGGVDDPGRWIRLRRSVNGGDAQLATTVSIRQKSAGAFTFYLDAVQVEAHGYPTTYADGDLEGRYRWQGPRHGSPSTRHAHERLGGREIDLAALGVKVQQMAGWGLPDQQFNTQTVPLLPGSLFQSVQPLARRLVLVLSFSHTTLPGLHQRRQAFIDLIQPDVTGQGQPFVLGYRGAHPRRTLYGLFRYESGMTGTQIGGGQTVVEGDHKVPVVLTAVDPYWREDTRQSVPMNFGDGLDPLDYFVMRRDGFWRQPAGATNGPVNALLWASDGRLYAAGAFTNIEGVAANRIAWWDGVTWHPMGAGLNDEGFALAEGPDGTIYVGGAFTQAGGVTVNHIAAWKPSAESWSALGGGANGFVLALTVTPNNRLYAGGAFTQIGGQAIEHIAWWNGLNWQPAGTGLPNVVRALESTPDNRVYAGGAFMLGQGAPGENIAEFDGDATWTAMGNGLDGVVLALHLARDGQLYAGGEFTAIRGKSGAAPQPCGGIAVWSGNAWRALGKGTNGVVQAIGEDPSGLIYVAGRFTEVDTQGDRNVPTPVAIWNGHHWLVSDVDLPFDSDINDPDSLHVRAVAVSAQGDVALGYNKAGVGGCAADTFVNVLATREVYPVITIGEPQLGPNRLRWIENVTTGQRLYFNLLINPGEIITIDTRPGQRGVRSNWRGEIGDQPVLTSEMGHFHLAPGLNVLAGFITGPMTSGYATISWEVEHGSVDGAA